VTSTSMLSRGFAGVLLSAVIVELTAATAYIHLTLGGTLFLLNAIGYVVFGLAYVVALAVPVPFVRRFGWLARVGLAGYTLATIVAYLLIGPYFALGWITKGIELAIVGLLAADLLGTYGSAGGVLRSAVASFTAPAAQGGGQRG
jgi:hypothetical protein